MAFLYDLLTIVGGIAQLIPRRGLTRMLSLQSSCRMITPPFPPLPARGLFVGSPPFVLLPPRTRMLGRVGRQWSGAVQAARYARLRARATVPSWATVNPFETGEPQELPRLYNLVNGEWQDTKEREVVVDPLNGKPMLSVPSTGVEELQPFVESMARVPKSGLHNPFKKPSRYLMYGEISRRAGLLLSQEEVFEYFVKAIQRVVPKSYTQAANEVRVTQAFLENFAGDNVRFLARGFSVPGNHLGQASHGHRWPYGAVALVAPFNFPLEIPVLQLMGALFMGNKPVVKGTSSVATVLEQFVRLLHVAGMPKEDLDLIHCEGPVMNKLILDAPIRLTQFTGSSRVAEKLAHETNGKVKIEDAGFDWKILGPDNQDEEYVAWQCDEDAYACQGQKCSAQSMLFMHKNWSKTKFLDTLKARAATRKLEDLTIGPVLTQTTESMLAHTEKLLAIPGARLLFGGKELANHTIPKQYGALEPTAVFVPIEEVAKPEHFATVTTEIFGPFQVVTEFDYDQIDVVLDCLESMSHHLTAAVVSNYVPFVNHIIGNSVNGTSYVGVRARTTGAPQNHWFGPGGDPRGAGIGSPEAIKVTWSCHREIVYDNGPVGTDWTPPAST